MNVTEIMEYVRRKVANGDLTIEEVERAINREIKLKRVDRTKERDTGATRLLKELKDIIKSCVVRNTHGEYIYNTTYSHDGLKTLNKECDKIWEKYESCLEKDTPTLSRTTIWRVKKEIAEYIIKRYPEQYSEERTRISKVMGLRDYI